MSCFGDIICTAYFLMIVAQHILITEWTPCNDKALEIIRSGPILPNTTTTTTADMPAPAHFAEETTPLISNDGGPEPFPKVQNHPRRTVALMSLMILCLSCAGSLCRVPQTRLLEDVLCHRFYQDIYAGGDAIDERLCKVDRVQSQLAYILGASSMIDAIIGEPF